MSNFKKTIILLSIVLVLGGVIYFLYFGTGTIFPSLTTEISDQPVGDDILVLVQRLKTVSIDQSVFSTALFTNLSDYSVPIFSESQGRLNPFNQIGDEGR